MTTTAFLSVLLLAAAQQTSLIQQTSSGWCSPDIANVTGNVTVTCKGVDPRAVAELNAQLSRMKLDRTQSIIEANNWAQKYHELEKQLAQLGQASQLYRQAQEYLHRGDLNKAGELLDQSLAKEESDIAARHYLRALLFELQFRPLDALPHVQKAVQFAPDNVEFAAHYAQLLQRQNHYADAEKIYDPTVKKLHELAKNNYAAYAPDLAR